jgi:uncharacterized protein (DUF2235 family)
VTFTEQRLALDERRAGFEPTLWALQTDKNTNTKLKQVWFPGVHCSVGGGDTTHGLSDVSLAWMVDQIYTSTGLQFDWDRLTYARTQQRASTGSLWTNNYQPKWPDHPWGCEPWEESYTGIYLLSGWRWRTPGKYFDHEHKFRWNQTSPPKPTEVTTESAHRSVSARKKLNSGGYLKKYDSEALKRGIKLEIAELGAVERRWRWGDDVVTST